MSKTKSDSGAKAPVQFLSELKQPALVYSAECVHCHAVREIRYMEYTAEGWVCIDCMRKVSVCDTAV